MAVSFSMALGRITKDGGKVLTVENDGKGGSHMYGGVGSDWARWREVEAEFEALAKEWNRDFEFPGGSRTATRSSGT